MFGLELDATVSHSVGKIEPFLRFRGHFLETLVVGTPPIKKGNALRWEMSVVLRTQFRSEAYIGRNALTVELWTVGISQDELLATYASS